MLGPLSKAIATSFDIYSYQVITLSSFILIGTIISLIFSGHVAFVLVHKRALILSLFLFVAEFICASLAPSLSFFKIGLFIIGMSISLYPGSGIPIANRLSSESIRGNVMAIHETGRVAAFVFIPLFSSMVLYVADSQVVFFVFTLMSTLLAVLIIVGCLEGYFRESLLSFCNVKRLFIYYPFWILGMAFPITAAVNITSILLWLITWYSSRDLNIKQFREYWV